MAFGLSGTATSGSDYTPLNPQSVTIGTARFADVTISPVAQINSESTETVTLGLTGGTGYALGPDNSATAHIVESDNGVQLTLKIRTVNYNGLERDLYAGSSDPIPLLPAVFEISANRVPPRTTLQVQLSGPATPGTGPDDTANDYYLTFADGDLTVIPGSPSVVTLTIEPQGQFFYLILWPIEDGKAEPDEELTGEILASPTSAYEPDNSASLRRIVIEDFPP